MPLDLQAILALMTTRGLSQRALGRLAGIDQPRISRIVNGHQVEHIELAVVQRLAAALGVGVEAILRK